MSKIKVLFLAANPAGTTQLQLDEEIREITKKIRVAEYRDSLEIIPQFAVRADDLLQALLEHKPHIVHFSGHGSDAGELIVVDDSGTAKPISKTALAHLLKTLRDNIRVVLLNACYSHEQAEAIGNTIDCTIGMNKEIGDSAAIVFAASFYRAVGFGRSIQEAFDLGKTALLLEGIPEEGTPELVLRDSINAANITLVQAGAKEEHQASNPLFDSIWSNLDETLQDAFALAATAAHRSGKDYISTKTLFSALLRINPAPLPEFFSNIPAGAISDSIPTNLEGNTHSITNIRSLSPCVNKSLTKLSPLATSEHKISSKDIFVDIAKHGTGASVQRLRTHGVSKERIDEIVNQLGWEILEPTGQVPKNDNAGPDPSL